MWERLGEEDPNLCTCACVCVCVCVCVFVWVCVYLGVHWWRRAGAAVIGFICTAEGFYSTAVLRSTEYLTANADLTL